MHILEKDDPKEKTTHFIKVSELILKIGVNYICGVKYLLITS